MNSALIRQDFDQQQMAVIETQLFPQGTTKAEQAYCLSVARELCLNPITREIFFVSRRQKVGDKWQSKVDPMVGRDGFLSIAHRTNQFAGIETSAGIREVPQLENGQWVIKQQLVAESTVWRKDSDKPVTVQVSYNEYCQRTAEGTPTRFWLEKPETMLKKVAESQALRKAFNIHGVYSPEELGAGFELTNGEIVTSAIDADCRRIETDKAHLSIVKNPLDETSAIQEQIPTAIPTQSAPVNEQDSRIVDIEARKIIELLKSRNIVHDITLTGNEGLIAAKSYNEKDLLKSSGFKWSTESKRWHYKFRNEPF